VLSGRRKRFRVDQVTPKHRYYNYHDTLELWGSIFGHASVVVREFDRRRLIAGDVRRHFLGLLGIDDAGFSCGKDENVSLDAQQVEALRLVNAYLPRFDEGGREAYELAMAIRSRPVDHLPKGDRLGAMLNAAKRRSIMQAFQPTNALLSSPFPDCRFVDDWQTVRTVQRSRPFALTAAELAGTIAEVGLQLVELASGKARLEAELTKANVELAAVRGRLDQGPPSPPARPSVPVRAVRSFVLAAQRGLGRGDEGS
jgi:hypothetical protein